MVVPMFLLLRDFFSWISSQPWRAGRDLATPGRRRRAGPAGGGAAGSKNEIARRGELLGGNRLEAPRQCSAESNEAGACETIFHLEEQSHDEEGPPLPPHHPPIGSMDLAGASRCPAMRKMSGSASSISSQAGSMAQSGGMFSCIIIASQLVLALLVLLRIFSALRRRTTRRKFGIDPDAKTIAFFHPYCDSAGGGERVLWRAIHALGQLSESRGQKLHILIYIGGDGDVQTDVILGKARRVFNLPLDASSPVPLTFVKINSRHLLEPSRYPVATILGQSLGSMVVAVDCLRTAMPDVWVDSTGFAFSIAAARAHGCGTAAYVHYPTISTDMLLRVKSRSADYNHSSEIAASATASIAKWVYYWAFAVIYGAVGCMTQVVMVNSSWTRNHITKLWLLRTPRIVYPPCDTLELKRLPLDDGGREPLVLSLGQFRPEKNHALQLESFSRSLDKEGVPSNARLILVGGVRNADDEALLTSLKMRAAALGVASRVDFVVGCSFEELRGYLRRASVGVHTMRDEHFGIGIVEMMAAGLVVIAHRSGGPKEDIIEEGTNGYLAEDESEYADIIATVLRSKPGGWADIRASARLSVDRFSNESFDGGFKTSMRSLLTSS